MATNDVQDLSQLEKLPAELRSCIYTMAVVPNTAIDLARYGYIDRRTTYTPALARTNSNIRKEVLAIFYGQTRFTVELGSLFPHNSDLRMWLQRHSQCVALMRHVSIRQRIWRAEDITLELGASISENDSIIVKFRGLPSKWSHCICEIRGVVEQAKRRWEHVLPAGRTGILEAELMVACWTDMQSTVRNNSVQKTCTRCEKYNPIVKRPTEDSGSHDHRPLTTRWEFDLQLKNV